MAISILSKPVKSSCYFNAVGNPIVYRLLRADYSFAQINDVAGDAQLQFNGGDFTAYYEVGNTVYVTRAGYETTGEITASSFSGGNTLVTLDLAYVDSGTGSANNLDKRTDYKMSIRIEDENGEAYGPLLEYSPGTDGLVIVDVSAIVRPELYPSWENITTGDMEEPGGAFKFRISYAEYYDEAFTSYTDDSQWVVAIFASMQLFNDVLTLERNPDGGNMTAYIPGSVNSKWLTRMERVQLWRGWPFTLSFIWPYGGITILKKNVEQKNESGGSVDSFTDFIVTRQDKVVRFALEDPIHASAKTIEVMILNTSDAQYSKVLYIDVNEPCSKPVHLVWKNSLGGDSFWQFSFNQEYEYAFSQGRKVQRLTLYADHLTVDQWEALNELNSPTEVYPSVVNDLAMDDSVVRTTYRNDQQVYMVSEDGETKVGVIVIPTNNKTRSRYSKHSIEIQIELPDTFIV